jgi:pseudouridine synthase
MSSDRNRKSPAEVSGDVRLNVFLQENGIASRRKADELISSGVVKVNGKSVTQLGTRISRTDKVHVHGKLVSSKSLPQVVYILNKPDMCLTTRFDAKMRRTIFDLAAVKNLPPNVQAVGRLDYRSEGLLLLTNDGDLAYALTHPRFSVEKTYAVLVSDGVTIEDVEKLRAGVMLDDGMAKAVSVRMGNKERMGATRGQWLELVVTEGRNRLIRRMAEAIGLKVVRLVRTGIGEIILPATLKPGSIIAVDAQAQEHLEQIKSDMLSSSGESKAVALDEATRAKRRLKKKLNLNDDEYAFEASRRAAEASEKRKQRVQASESMKVADGPVQTSDRPRREDRLDSRPQPKGRATREERSDSRPQPKGRATREERSDSRPQAKGRPSRDERSDSRPQPKGRPSRDDRSDSRPQPKGRPARGERSDSRPQRQNSASASRTGKPSRDASRRPSSDKGPVPVQRKGRR